MIKIEIAVDFHGRVHKPMVKPLMRELEQYRLMFIEEPVLCENAEVFAQLRDFSSTPIATRRAAVQPLGF